MNLTWENNEKPNFESFLAQIWSLKNFFVTFTSTRHYDKVTLHAIFRKIYDAKTQENGGKPYFGSNLGPLDQDLGRQFFFQKPGSLNHWFSRSPIIKYNIRKN